MRNLIVAATLLASAAVPALAGGPVSIVWLATSVNSEIVWFSDNAACEMDFVSSGANWTVVPPGIPMAAHAIIWRAQAITQTPGFDQFYYTLGGGGASLDGYEYCVEISG
jgi:hypothetical protein